MAGWATSRSQRHNLVAQRLNLCCLAFLSLLLLISIASADLVSFEDHCNDKGECPSFSSDLKKDANIDGRRVKWRNRTSEQAAPIFTGYCYMDFSAGFHGSVPDQDFVWGTNRLDYFRVTALDVNGDNHLLGNASYGDGGGGGSDHGVVVGPRVEQERGDAPDGAHGGDMTPQVPVRTFDNTGSDEVDEAIIHRLNHERDDGGHGVGDGQDGGGLVVVGWWERWWVWLALWKMV
ncbi:hypothetical protein L2E82_18348 [Cichorium intybus]|uniref:Uncharacterized protein n=1 Tax=Cichorium intybus TaxID=13427 RepID=A0ACB9F9D0_CICIN|nr:hypothetical protein L2E82_18348 [Cichorium intybus]